MASQSDTEVTCPTCDRSAVMPESTTCFDCASDLDRTIATVADACKVLTAAFDADVVPDEVVDDIATTGADLEERLADISSGRLHGLIDRAKHEARMAERERLGRIFAEWRANGALTGSAPEDFDLIARLFATDY